MILLFNNSAKKAQRQSKVRWAGFPGRLPHLQYTARLPREEVTRAALEIRQQDSFAFCSVLIGLLKRYCIFFLYTGQRQSEWYESQYLDNKLFLFCKMLYRSYTYDDVGVPTVILSLSLYSIFCLKAAKVHRHTILISEWCDSTLFWKYRIWSVVQKLSAHIFNRYKTVKIVLKINNTSC